MTKSGKLLWKMTRMQQDWKPATGQQQDCRPTAGLLASEPTEIGAEEVAEIQPHKTDTGHGGYCNSAKTVDSCSLLTAAAQQGQEIATAQWEQVMAAA